MVFIGPPLFSLVKDQGPVDFPMPEQSIPWCMFGANLVIPAQIIKSVTSYHADNVKFTDGQTDRRRQRQYPFGQKGQGVKMVLGPKKMDIS